MIREYPIQEFYCHNQNAYVHNFYYDPQERIVSATYQTIEKDGNPSPPKTLIKHLPKHALCTSGNQAIAISYFTFEDGSRVDDFFFQGKCPQCQYLERCSLAIRHSRMLPEL